MPMSLAGCIVIEAWYCAVRPGGRVLEGACDVRQLDAHAGRRRRRRAGVGTDNSFLLLPAETRPDTTCFCRY